MDIDWQIPKGQLGKQQKKIPMYHLPQMESMIFVLNSLPKLMGRFQASLRKQNLGLIVVGFGFNDNHISHPLIQALKSNVHLKVLIVDPILKESTNGHLKQIEELADSGDWRIGLLSGKFEDMVQFLPDIQKESEIDQHFKRVKGLV